MIVKIGKSEQKWETKTISRAVENFVKIKTQIDALTERLTQEKDIIVNFAKKILEAHDQNTLTLIADDNNKVKVTFGLDIKVGDVQKLRLLLKDKFDILVRCDEVYKPEPKLREMSEHDENIRECLIIKEKAPSVSVV